MEKAIEIKRRAQRCIQNGDLDGALNEYEKLVGSEDSDPYNYVLLADLLFKKGDHGGASDRYLAAVEAYERASLFKNAIAVCKKMLRLSLSPAKVLHALGNLHALDGLAGEAALYYVQYAEHMVRSNLPQEAASALRQAFDVSQENIRVLEQLSEAWLLAGENGQASQALVEAACHYRDRGSESDARRCLDRAAHLDPTLGDAPAASAGLAVPGVPVAHAVPAAAQDDEGPTFAMAHLPVPTDGSAQHPHSPPDSSGLRLATDDHEPAAHGKAIAPAPALRLERLNDLESGRHDAAPPSESPTFRLDNGAHAADAHAPVSEAADFSGDEPEEVEYVIDEEPDATATAVAGFDASEEPAETETVYEIAADELVEFDEPSAPEPDSETVYEIADDSLATPEEPGLAREPLAARSAAAAAPVETPVPEVEELLASAQEQFRAGDREQASHTLTLAAQAYEAHDRFDSAATIYRSLGRGAHATPEILELWLGNCERRNDAHEGATVACDLGDRALNDGDEDGARGWFERAIVLDGDSDTARRRLERLAAASAAAQAAVAVATPEVAAGNTDPAGSAPGQRVEIEVGRAEAVSFDLAGLLAEFQRGVDAQLAGDAQSHYDLAMTYREMGLLEQAQESFRSAERDARFTARAAEMVGRCLADQGRHEDATVEFARALALPDVTAENDMELRYHFGNSLVELGRLEEALPEYEQVMARMPDFEDVRARHEALRRTLGLA